MYSRYANLSILARLTLQLKLIGILRSVLVNLQNLGQIEQWYRASWARGPAKFKRAYTMHIFFYRENKREGETREEIFLYFARMCTDQREKRDRCALSRKNKKCVCLSSRKETNEERKRERD